MGGGGGGSCTLDAGLMDETTSLNLLGGFVFILFLFVTLSGNTDFSNIQRASLEDRLKYTSHMNVYFCLVTIFCYVIHVVGALMHVDHGFLNKMSYGEYLLTCPLMMISFVLLGGPRVRDSWRPMAGWLTVLVIAFGAVATLLSSKVVAMLCFVFASAFFAMLMYIVNVCVKTHSMGKEELFKGTPTDKCSAYKKLGRKLFFTWILFPMWWLLCPDGFGLATDSEVANSAVKLMMNIVAKGMYICFIRLLQHKFEGRTEMIDELEQEADNHHKMAHVEVQGHQKHVLCEEPRSSSSTTVSDTPPIDGVLSISPPMSPHFQRRNSRNSQGSSQQFEVYSGNMNGSKQTSKKGFKQPSKNEKSDAVLMEALDILGKTDPSVLHHFGVSLAQKSHTRMTEDVDLEFGHPDSDGEVPCWDLPPERLTCDPNVRGA